MTERSILIAEDDESDVLLLQRAFKEAQLQQPVEFAHDGQAAIEFLTARCQAASDQLPALVILDLKMPRRNGLEVLQWLRSQLVLGCLPAVIFSSSSRREDVETAYALGASAYIVKPPSTVQRTEVARFIKTWLELTHPPMASLEGFKIAQAAHATQPFGKMQRS